jgi:hypothetical protein
MTRVVVHNHIPARDAVATTRATDGLNISKNFKFRTSTELNLGKVGWGEIEFNVAVKVSIDASVTGIVGRNEWWVAENEYDDGVKAPIPTTAVMAALERYLTSPDGRESVLDAIREEM